MQNPETGQWEPEQEVPQEDSLEILRKERRGLKSSPRMKELLQKLGKLGYDHRQFKSQYNFYEAGIRTGTINNLSKEQQEDVRKKAKEFLEKLEENEAEQTRINQEIEKIEDEAKKRIRSAFKKAL